MKQQIHADRLQPARLGICLIYENVYTRWAYDARNVVLRLDLSGMTFVAYGRYRFLISRRCFLRHTPSARIIIVVVALSRNNFFFIFDTFLVPPLFLRAN